jgi:hypothetical protein
VRGVIDIFLSPGYEYLIDTKKQERSMGGTVCKLPKAQQEQKIDKYGCPVFIENRENKHAAHCMQKGVMRIIEDKRI